MRILKQPRFKQIELNYGDIVIGGVGSLGVSGDAAFLGSFVKRDQVWAHFDTVGVDYLDEDRPTVPKGYCGWGVGMRTLVSAKFFCGSESLCVGATHSFHFAILSTGQEYV